MSNVFFIVQEEMLTNGYAWASRPLVAYLVSSAFVPQFGIEQQLNACPSGSILAGPVSLTGLNTGNGVASAYNVNFGSITTEVPVAAVLIADTGLGSGTVSNPTLVLYLNQGLGFGQTVSGLEVEIIWDTRGIWSP